MLLPFEEDLGPILCLILLPDVKAFQQPPLCQALNSIRVLHAMLMLQGSHTCQWFFTTLHGPLLTWMGQDLTSQKLKVLMLSLLTMSFLRQHLRTQHLGGCWSSPCPA